jgi:lysyl-tRNA synthetase class 2
VADWRPSAGAELLQARARMLSGIRAFFMAQGVLEVETPLLCRAGVTDPHIEGFAVPTGDETRFLQTSPEYAMKRLLAAGSGDIYQLGKAFRRGEAGARHNPEFTLLEWYRTGFDHHRLMLDVADLITALFAPNVPVFEYRSHAEVFQRALGLDPQGADIDACRMAARRAGMDFEGDLDRDGWLDLLMTHRVAPSLPADRFTFIHGYPASQASLARLNADGQTAARFELYHGDLELANGFHELSDADEQRRRFEADQACRERMGLEPRVADEALLVALEHDLPDCAGVALGVDRLLMVATGSQHISDVLSFDWPRA